MKAIFKFLLMIVLTFSYIIPKQDSLEVSFSPKNPGASNIGQDFWFSIPPGPDGTGEDYLRIFIKSFVKH